MSARPPRRQRGLTLIELMVALAIFAVLGVLSYRALAEVSTSRTRLEEGFERWRSIGRAMQRIDTDLLQLVAPATSSSPSWYRLTIRFNATYRLFSNAAAAVTVADASRTASTRI